MIYKIIQYGGGRNIMISIVLPTYNGEKYLAQSIDSILRQTYENWELIIVNDCSTDSTREIAESYARKDRRITVINNEVNKKLPASLNIGFEKARGELFTWTSDDNAFAPKALENMLNALVNNNADLVYANITFIDYEDYILFDNPGDPLEELPIHDVIEACFLYKREIHETLNGYDVHKFLVEDYDFFLRAYWRYKFYHLDEFLYFYRIHGTSLTAQRKKDAELAAASLLEENIGFVTDEKIKLRVQERIDKIKSKYALL